MSKGSCEMPAMRCWGRESLDYIRNEKGRLQSGWLLRIISAHHHGEQVWACASSAFSPEISQREEGWASPWLPVAVAWVVCFSIPCRWCQDLQSSFPRTARKCCWLYLKVSNKNDPTPPALNSLSSHPPSRHTSPSPRYPSASSIKMTPILSTAPAIHPIRCLARSLRSSSTNHASLLGPRLSDRLDHGREFGFRAARRGEDGRAGRVCAPRPPLLAPGTVTVTVSTFSRSVGRPSDEVRRVTDWSCRRRLWQGLQRPLCLLLFWRRRMDPE